MANLNSEQIKQCIPHRSPFLWVDEVLEMTESRILARKYLDPDLDVFRGHYPDFPIFPGVLLCEACFQCGAILISKLQAVGGNQVPVVTRVNNVKFRQIARPGDTLELEVELTERLQDAFFLTGKISVQGKVAARLEFACTATTKPA